MQGTFRIQLHSCDWTILKLMMAGVLVHCAQTGSQEMELNKAHLICKHSGNRQSHTELPEWWAPSKSGGGGN